MSCDLCTGGTWSEEALQCLDELTLCATWRVVMVMTYGVSEQGPSVVIVDTSTEQVRHADCAAAASCVTAARM